MPEDKELSFWDHLDVLRHLLMRVVVVWLVFGIGYFILMPEIFDKVILAPCYDNFVFYDLLKYIGTSLGFTGDFFTKEFTVHLININMAAQFFTHLSTAFWLSVVTAVPYLIYEAWRFIAPALYKEEKRGVRKAFLLGTVMFFIGVAVGYFMVFPLTLRFLATSELSGAIENQISLNSYIDIFMMLILCIGLSFELPLVTWILYLIGLLNRKTMREYRRHSVIVIFILAAIITPTGDPFTLSVVAIPLCLLYEMSIYLMKK